MLKINKMELVSVYTKLLFTYKISNNTQPRNIIISLNIISKNLSPLSRLKLNF